MICVTINLWTNCQMWRFLGITGHYIRNYNLVSAMLACKHLKECNTAVTAYSTYAGVLQALNITNEASYIVSNNVTKASSLFGFAMQHQNLLWLTRRQYTRVTIISNRMTPLQSPAKASLIFSQNTHPWFANTLQLPDILKEKRHQILSPFGEETD